MWPTLINCNGLASSPFTPNPIVSIVAEPGCPQDVPLEPFRRGGTCKEAIDLASEAKRTSWTVPWMSTSDLNRHVPLSCQYANLVILLFSSAFHFTPLKSSSGCNEQYAFYLPSTLICLYWCLCHVFAHCRSCESLTQTEAKELNAAFAVCFHYTNLIYLNKHHGFWKEISE